MSRYKFLLRPLFYIFSILFSSWMVLWIESISPSDFGKYGALFSTPVPAPPGGRDQLKKLYREYKSGRISSDEFEKKFEDLLKTFPDDPGNVPLDSKKEKNEYTDPGR
ncbi:MAG: SHOCT domain-containing protein [Bacteroidota bacterium]